MVNNQRKSRHNNSDGESPETLSNDPPAESQPDTPVEKFVRIKKRERPKRDERKKLSATRLPAKLKAIRRKHGLSQAAMLCIINPYEEEDNRARVSQYERGLRIPSLIEVYNYAKYIGVSMDVLVDDNLGLPQAYKHYFDEIN